MIVDDELPIGVYVKKSLEKNEDSFDITYINNPLDAAEIALQTHFDLAIIDLKMPQMNGLELSSLIREKSAVNKNIHIVIYSSVTDTNVKLKALGPPVYADGFIHKGEDSIDFLVHQIRSIFWRGEAKMMEEKVKTAQLLGKSIGHVASQSLSVILGYSEIIEKSIKEDKFDRDKFIKFLKTIKNSAKNINSLVENIKTIKEIKEVDIGNGGRIIDIVPEQN